MLGALFMADVTEIINYFNKLNKIINYEADFTLIDIKFVKKNKIDDILCCILKLLPDSYKRIMKQKEGKKLNSVLAYDMLFSAIKNKFIFNSDVYLVRFKDVTKYVKIIASTLERDIEYVEKNY